MNKNTGIYKITSPSGKIYIGQSKSIQRRFSEYEKSQNFKNQRKLYNSLKKYGVENHQFDIIEYCDVEQLNCSERFWQDEFDVLGKQGLNCILQKCGEQRREHTKETRERMSKSQIERGKNYVNPMKGKKHTEESKKKMSESNSKFYKGKKLSEEHIQKRTEGRGSMKGEKNPMFGKKLNKEQLENLKNAMRNSSNSKKVIDLNNGVIYRSVTEASELLCINIRTLRDKLNGIRKNDTTLRYYTDEQ